MPLLKFSLRWEDDMNVIRDIEILHTQTFLDFHEIIKQSFAFPKEMEAIIYVSNDYWHKGQAISSIVEKNIRGAAELAMVKTPLGALLNEQNQKFVYATSHKKKWELQVELISMRPDPMDVASYPKCVREVGISPAQFGDHSIEKDAVVEIIEKYDLNDPDEMDGLDDLLTEGEDNNDDLGDDDMDMPDFNMDDLDS